MSEPIKIGDLVYIRKWPCCGLGLGITFVVAELVPPDLSISWRCRNCHAEFPKETKVSSADAGNGRGYASPLSWVRKIRPLEQLEGVSRDVRVPALHGPSGTSGADYCRLILK